jgi:hypothetical protein
MDAALESKLIQCLDDLENGESLDQVLARYPDDADQLRPLLETSVQLSEMPLAYSVGARSKSREAFLKEASLLRDGPAQPWVIFGGFRRLALTLSSAAMVGIFVLAILIGIATSSIPGDALYGTKLTVENMRLALTSDLEAKRALEDQFEQERLREIGALLKAGRQADVEFRGRIESIQADSWIVAGLPVIVGPDTDVDQDPWIGAFALVVGRTEDGQVQALSITIIGSPDEPQPSPTPEPQIMPTTIERPLATPSPTPSQRGQEGTMPPDAASSRPSPTYTPTPTSLQPAPPDGGGDDNMNEGEDESNDNEEPDEGNDNEELDEDNDNEEPDEGNDNEELDEDNDNEEPDEGNDNEEPDESNDNEEPDEGNDNEEPDESNDNEEPDEGNDNEEPDEGNDNEEPDEGNDYEEPEESNDNEEEKESNENKS